MGVSRLYSSKNKLGDKYSVVPILGVLYIIIIMSTHAEENMYDTFLWFDIGVVHIGRIKKTFRLNFFVLYRTLLRRSYHGID